MDKYELLDIILMFIMREYEMRDIFNNRVIEKGPPNELYVFMTSGIQITTRSVVGLLKL